MRTKKLIAVLSLVAGAALALQDAGGQERATAPRQEKTSVEINARAFLVPRRQSQATTSFLTRAGKAQQVKLVIKSWGIPHAKERLQFPEKGFLVFYLRAGSMTTFVNGEELKRGPGEFWTVPEGAVMSFDVTSETVTFETFSLP